MLVTLSACASVEVNAPVLKETGTLYRTSMMDAAAYRGITILPTRCTRQSLKIKVDVPGKGPNGRPVLRVRIEKNWSPGFDVSRRGVVLPMSAIVEKRQNDEWSSRKVTGFVEFRDLSTCRIRRAAFVPSEDTSLIEPPLWILDVSPPQREFWVPRMVILTAYRALLNETLSVVGPVLFRTPSRYYHPVFLVNGVVQKSDTLRGVTPPDFSGKIHGTLWLKGDDQELKIIGSGETGLFEVKSDHTLGMGVFLPYPTPFYLFPAKEYRVALAGSLLVDGPFALDGRLSFDREERLVSLKARINEAGSVVGDFQIQVPYHTGKATRFDLPGEVDFSLSFNHRRIDLVMLPDANRRLYWLGSLNQNLFGLADPT